MNQSLRLEMIPLSDPDGVTTFYGCNSRGEGSTTILDIGGDGVADLVLRTKLMSYWFSRIVTVCFTAKVVRRAFQAKLG